MSRRRIVALLWLYFGLLICEGVLRKWVFPELSDPLLIVRDPVAAAILYLAARDGFLRVEGWLRPLLWLLAAFVLLGVLQLVVYGVPLPVMAFGLRTYFLHPPLIFVMARVLDRCDIRRFVISTLLLAVPIAWLMVQQFYASPADEINRGAGGAAQLLSAMGKVRPAGPFSFISGPVLFYSVVLACLIAASFRRMQVSILVQVLAWAALIVATSVSGSRSLVFGFVPVFLVLGLAVVKRPQLTGHVVRAAILATAAIMTVWGSTAVQEGLEVFNARVEAAGGTDELVRRSSDAYVLSLSAWTDAPLLGLGIGLGTNAGNALVDARAFRFGEDEWSRVLYEAGPLLGTAYLVWRVGLAVWLLSAALRALSVGDVLPLVMIGAAFTNVVLGSWGQPTTQGFSIWSAGLCLAGLTVAVSEARVVAALRTGRSREGVRPPLASPGTWSMLATR